MNKLIRADLPVSERSSFMDTLASMQASLRWNDNGGRSGFVAIPIAPSPFLPNS